MLSHVNIIANSDMSTCHKLACIENLLASQSQFILKSSL